MPTTLTQHTKAKPLEQLDPSIMRLLLMRIRSLVIIQDDNIYNNSDIDKEENDNFDDIYNCNRVCLNKKLSIIKYLKISFISFL